MSTGKDFVKDVIDRAVDMAKVQADGLDEHLDDALYGVHRLTDAEFYAAISLLMEGNPDRDIPSRPGFLLAKLATKDGRPMVQGGRELVRRYERVRDEIEGAL